MSDMMFLNKIIAGKNTNTAADTAADTAAEAAAGLPNQTFSSKFIDCA